MIPDDVREKYNNCPTFHRIVDVIYELIVQAYMTPHEVRQAATLACIKYEMEKKPLGAKHLTKRRPRHEKP
jgi:hypothetical protein